MGCSRHSKFSEKNKTKNDKEIKETSHSFILYLLHLEQSKQELIAKIKVKHKENFNVVEKLTIPMYVKKSSNKELKELFDYKVITNCIFILYYYDIKSKKTCDYDEVFNNILFETNGLLQKVYVLDIRSVLKLNLKYEDFLALIKDDYDIVDKIVNIPLSEEAKQLEEDIVLRKDVETFDPDDENEIEGGKNILNKYYLGTKIEINRELTADNLHTYLYRIKNEKIILFQIRRNHFTDLNLFKAILNELSNGKYLRTFIFTDNFNTTGFEEGWRLITQFFKTNKSIRNINFSLSFLYDKYLQDLMTDGLKYKKIVNLDLSSNFITYSGCKKIADWIDTNKSLKSLNLQQNTMNEFKKDGSDMIVSKLANHNRILSLDLSNMILTGLGEKMSEFIKTTKTLKELRIQNIRINLDDYKMICNALCENETIKELNISDNNCESDTAINLIAHFIKNNKNIKILKLDNLGITKKNSQLLFESIKINQTIENYSFNENPKLKFKNLYDNLFDKVCINAISFILKERKENKKKKENEELIAKFKNERRDVILSV